MFLSFPELSSQTPVSGYSRTQVADEVVSQSCFRSSLSSFLVHSRGVHSVTLIVHLLSLNRVPSIHVFSS